MNLKTKICFYVSNCYSLFDAKTKFGFGGAELRSSILAKELAKFQNLSIAFITDNFNQLPHQKINNVYLVSDRYNRNIHQIPSLTNKIINQLFDLKLKIAFYLNGKKENFAGYLKNYWFKIINADYYCVFSMTQESRNLIDFCINNNKKYIQFLASDEELNGSKKNLIGINKEIIEHCLNHADKIIVQNNFQQTKIELDYKLKSFLLKSPIIIDKVKFVDQSENKFILWVGKSSDIKQPILLIEIAKKNPEFNFVMICSKSDENIHKEVLKTLPSNVQFFEQLSFSETENWFKNSFLLISTSLVEGFPNTFLQAAKYSLPVISANVNPDNYITDNQCGYLVSNKLEEFSTKIKLLKSDKTKYLQLAKNHFNYLIANHDSEMIAKQLQLIIAEK